MTAVMPVRTPQVPAWNSLTYFVTGGCVGAFPAPSAEPRHVLRSHGEKFMEE